VRDGGRGKVAVVDFIVSTRSDMGFLMFCRADYPAAETGTNRWIQSARKAEFLQDENEWCASLERDRHVRFDAALEQARQPWEAPRR
jgi:hypothetical protein